MFVDRIPLHPPPVSPLTPGTHRPLWSVMIPIYNGAAYLRQTLESLLAQDPGEHSMQIEVVDDCSTDADIFQLVNEVGNGRVHYHRQSQNVGSVLNFSTCLNRANGRYVHILHADDRVRPGLYKKLEQLFDRYPQAGAAFCNYSYIDSSSAWLYNNHTEMDHDGLLENYLPHIAVQCPVQYVCIAVKREVYEREGGFFGAVYGEDWEMWARIAKDYPLAYTPEILAEYRIHESNISSHSFRTGQNFRDIAAITEQISQYLPAEERQDAKRRARRHYARYALSFTEYIWHVSKDTRTVVTQVAGALRMHLDYLMLLKAAKMYAKVLLEPVRKRLKV